MTKTFSRSTVTTLLAILLLAGSQQLYAGTRDSANEPGPATIPAAIRHALLRIVPGREADRISPAVIPGLYEVIFGTDIFYVTADGKHLLQGDLYDLDSQTNLTEAKRTTGRAAVIDTIDPATMIIFKPERTRHVVSIFTDIDCGYCRKLHSEIETYLSKGIEIHYLAFPRSGKNTPSYFKAISVWCADNRQQALTSAKSGHEIEAKSCANPVDRHMAAANQLGISGTPTLVFADGSMLPGYLPADRLDQYLNSRLSPSPGTGGQDE